MYLVFTTNWGHKNSVAAVSIKREKEERAWDERQRGGPHPLPLIFPTISHCRSFRPLCERLEATLLRNVMLTVPRELGLPVLYKVAFFSARPRKTKVNSLFL